MKDKDYKRGKTIVRELATQEPIIFEEESVTLDLVIFNRNSIKLVIEKVN